MKNYDCMQGFLQLIIIFFMQEIGGNIWWVNVSLLNLFISQNYSDFKVTYMRYLGTRDFFLHAAGYPVCWRPKTEATRIKLKLKAAAAVTIMLLYHYYYFTTLRMSSSILDKNICWLKCPAYLNKGKRIVYSTP